MMFGIIVLAFKISEKTSCQKYALRFVTVVNGLVVMYHIVGISIAVI